MENKPNNQGKFTSFIEGKGFYVVLAVCLCAISVSGYLLFFTSPAQPEYVVDVPKENGSDYKTSNQVPDIKVKPEPPKEKEQPKQEDKSTSVNAPAKVTTSTPKEPIEYTMPVTGKILKSFSGGELVFDETMGDFRTHNGVDIACETGTRVTTIARGKVERVYNDGLYGNCVVISHEDGIKSVYKGLDKGITLKEGGAIKAGDVIGAAGETNITETMTPPHLHIEVMKDGKFIDLFELIK